MGIRTGGAVFQNSHGDLHTACEGLIVLDGIVVVVRDILVEGDGKRKTRDRTLSSYIERGLM
jgi:hypothetical protein